MSNWNFLKSIYFNRKKTSLLPDACVNIGWKRSSIFSDLVQGGTEVVSYFHLRHFRWFSYQRVEDVEIKIVENNDIDGASFEKRWLVCRCEWNKSRILHEIGCRMRRWGRGGAGGVKWQTSGADKAICDDTVWSIQ